MKISRHFFESLSDYQDLIPVLTKAGIPYRTLLNPADEPYLLVFDIIVDSPEWKIFVDEFPKHLSFPNSSAQMIFDEKEVDIIYSESFATPRIGQAIMNRLLKAAGHQVITV